MKESIRELKKILKKHKKTNFWSALRFLMVEVGKDQYESFLVAQKIYPNITKSAYNFGHDNTTIRVQMKTPVQNKDIEKIIDEGLERRVSFDDKDAYVDTITIIFPQGYLCKHIINLYKEAKGHLMYDDHSMEKMSEAYDVAIPGIISDAIDGGNGRLLREADRPMEMGEVRAPDQVEEVTQAYNGHGAVMGDINVNVEARPLRGDGDGAIGVNIDTTR